MKFTFLSQPGSPAPINKNRSSLLTKARIERKRVDGRLTRTRSERFAPLADVAAPYQHAVHGDGRKRRLKPIGLNWRLGVALIANVCIWWLVGSAVLRLCHH